MKVEAKNQKIENIFIKWKYNIPDYQREYDWNISNVEQLINDINENEINYFIWHMVFQWEFSWSQFDVIDWQQRITTIVIILSAIRDVLYAKWEIQLALWINDKYIFSKDVNNKDYVILSSDMPYPVFQKYVQSIPEKKEKIEPKNNGEKNIIEIYNYLYEDLSTLELEVLISFRDKVLNLEVIFVSVEEWDPFSIFATLNASWKDLTPMDLIKNQVFKNYDTLPHLNEPSDTWKKLLLNTREYKKFLNYSWSSRYKKVSDAKIYHEFKLEIIDKNKDIKTFLNDLYDDSEIFQLIINPQESDWTKDEYEIYFTLNALNIFSIKVAYSVLISLIRSYKKWILDKKWIIKALSIIERYHFINNAISSLRSSWLDTMYAKYAKSVHEASDKQRVNHVISDLKSQLSWKIPELSWVYDSMFLSKTFFTNKNTKNKRLINYILKKIELEKQNYNILMNNMSLEHILPQSVWNEEIVGQIWNIVLLDSGLNSSIWDKSFSIKKPNISEKSTIISTKEIFDKFDSFDIEEITNRTNNLKDFMFNEVWN